MSKFKDREPRQMEKFVASIGSIIEHPLNGNHKFPVKIHDIFNRKEVTLQRPVDEGRSATHQIRHDSMQYVPRQNSIPVKRPRSR